MVGNSPPIGANGDFFVSLAQKKKMRKWKESILKANLSTWVEDFFGIPKPPFFSELERKNPP